MHNELAANAAYNVLSNIYKWVAIYVTDRIFAILAQALLVKPVS